MVLVAVDDLLFSSKIRATAKQAGVELTFARSPEEIIGQARAIKPALVIFDLNSAKTDPINTISALKADPGLAGIRTLGFASHVHTDLIAAARRPAPTRSSRARRSPATSPRSCSRPRARPPDHQVRRRSGGATHRATRRADAAPALRSGCRRRAAPMSRSSSKASRPRSRTRLRGALNAVLRLQERQQHPPALVTASAGNHGRGLAFAAAIARLPLIVYVPKTRRGSSSTRSARRERT